MRIIPATIDGFDAIRTKSLGMHCFVKIGLVECRACDWMTEALISWTPDYKKLAVYGIEIDPASTSEPETQSQLAELQITEYPTLICLRNGAESKRWAGFFSDNDPDVRHYKMAQLIEKELHR